MTFEEALLRIARTPKAAIDKSSRPQKPKAAAKPPRAGSRKTA